MEEENVVKNNNTSKYVVIIAIVVIAVVGFIGGWYFYKSNDPKAVYTSTINGILDKYAKEVSSAEEVKTQNTTFKLSGKINTEDEEVKEVAEYINKIGLETNVQIDYEGQKELVNLDVIYDNDKVIDGQAYYDLSDKELYLYVQDLFDKYLKIDVSSSEYDEVNEAMKELLEVQEEMKLGEKVSLEKATKIFEEKISDKLLKEYFSKEEAELTIDGKQVKTTKFKLTLTQAQLIDIISSICNELAQDEEFLNCWEDKEELKEGLLDIVEQLEDVERDEKSTVEFGIYKKALINELVKFDMAILVDGDKGLFEVTKTAKNTYSYLVSVTEEGEDTVEITGTVKVDEVDKNTYKIEFSINIPEFGNVTLNFEISNKINEGIETINKSNSVSMQELTENDLTKIQENLQKMKIYELLEPLMSTSNALSGLTTDEDDYTTTLTTDDDDNYNETKLTTDSNSVKAYSGDMVVSYSVPSTFETGSYNSDNYKTYEKSNEDVKVTITVENKKIEDFNDEVESSKEYYAKSGNYKDVKTSNIQTLEANGKKFSVKTFEYTYVSSISSDYDTKYKKMYIFYDIDGKNSYNVEIEDADNVTQEEINQFLNFNVK